MNDLIKENINLANYSTFKIGGDAKFFATINNIDDLVKAIRFSREKNIPTAIIGAGCNLVIDDSGIDGLVLKMNMQEVEIIDKTLIAEAGISFSSLVGRSHSKNLVGLEWMASVPSSLGGGIRGNAGAFGGETKDLLKSILVYHEDKIQEIDSSEFKFNYRYSTFKEIDNKDIILGGKFELRAGDIKEARQNVVSFITKKRESQPTGFACSGCIFKNYQKEILDKNILDKHPEIIEFNKKKIIPTGYLIEKVNLKGYQIRHCQISEKHANYILNLENKASYSDLVQLISLIKESVYNEFGVNIEEEVSYLHKQLKFY